MNGEAANETYDDGWKRVDFKRYDGGEKLGKARNCRCATLC